MGCEHEFQRVSLNFSGSGCEKGLARCELGTRLERCSTAWLFGAELLEQRLRFHVIWNLTGAARVRTALVSWTRWRMAPAGIDTTLEPPQENREWQTAPPFQALLSGWTALGRGSYWEN